jgi:Rod binding domain-containing protein
MKPIGHPPIPLQPKAVQPLAAKDATTKRHAEAVKAAEQFETMMAQQMLQSMQRSLDGGNLLGTGQAADIYSSLGEWELARMLSRDGHLGLKEQILRQLPNEEDKANEIHAR